MTENWDDVSTLVEIEARSSVNLNDEDQEIKGNVQINENRFRMLCDNVENCFFHIDNSMFELLELKDKLLLQYLPRNVLLQITLVLSRFDRAYSQARVPVYELIRLVQLYSQPFDMKCSVLKRLYDNNETHKRMLNMAFQRLTSMKNNTKYYQEQKCINNWEKMYIRLALPRSNVRKWKFRIKTFREKAALGYEHVIDWIRPRIPTPSSAFEILSNEERIDDQDIDRFKTSNEIDEPKFQIEHDDELDSDDESNLLTEREKSKSVQQEPIVTKVDIEIQAQPDLDDQQTSTEDTLSAKSLIMRIYRPIGIPKTKFQCTVYVQGQKYTTKMFLFNQKSNARSTAVSRTTRIRKRNEVSTTSDNIDLNTIDKQQTDEFVIPMPNVLKRRSLFQTDIDPDAIKINVFADEKFSGSFILSSEDLRMLDLPNLYSPTFSPLIARDDNTSSDFDHSSNELYKSWISRTPPVFLIYNNKNESIGKLPLLMFWYNKLENTRATKYTMTVPMEIHVPPPITIPSPTIEIVIPRVAAEITGENHEPNGLDDQIEIIKTTYENEIAKLHENYQNEIHRLTDLLNQMIETSEFNENRSKLIQENQSNTKIRRQPNREVVMEHVYGKDLPKKFLDRYEMYLQRSIIHRHQLIEKIEHETALANERQMEIQHRLYRSERNNEYDNDLCLPAVFMPFRSGNIFNPRAYQFFHPVGSTPPRLTQAPSIFKFPSLPSRSVSVLNLFELSRKHENSNEKDHSTIQKSHSTVRPTTRASE